MKILPVLKAEILEQNRNIYLFISVENISSHRLSCTRKFLRNGCWWYHVRFGGSCYVGSVSNSCSRIMPEEKEKTLAEKMGFKEKEECSPVPWNYNGRSREVFCKLPLVPWRV